MTEQNSSAQTPSQVPIQTPEVVPQEKTETTSQASTQTHGNVSSQTQQIDVSAIEQKIESSVSEKVSKSVISKIGEALGLTKKEEQQLPTDPAELRKFIQDESKKQAEQLLQSRDQEQSEIAKQRQQQVDEGAQTFQQTWARDYAAMAEMGNVPKIENKDDKNDPGNVAKTRLLGKLKEVLDQNAQNGVEYVPSLWEIAARYPEVLRINTTAGADAPVSGGSRTGNQVNNEYARIHGTDFEDMLRPKLEA